MGSHWSIKFYLLVPGRFFYVLRGKCMTILFGQWCLFYPPSSASCKIRQSACRDSDVNVSSTFLSSEAAKGQINRILAGDNSVVFSSPEALLQQGDGRKLILSAYVQRNIIAVVVDEARCIVKWCVCVCARVCV